MTIVCVSQPSQKDLRSRYTVVGRYIKMRTEYGSKHHWPLDATGVDIDEYDQDPHSYYFLAEETYRLKKSLNAGLRLTRVNDFDSSLSLSMWAHAVDKPHVVHQMIEHKDDIMQLKAAAHNGQLWDLTRLVSAMSLQAERTPQMKRATYVALLLLLGAGLKHTGEDSVWIFTTNIEVRRFLEKLGLTYRLLATGRISYSDAGESYLGWISPHEAYRQMLASQHAVIAHLAARAYNQTIHHI